MGLSGRIQVAGTAHSSESWSPCQVVTLHAGKFELNSPHRNHTGPVFTHQNYLGSQHRRSSVQKRKKDAKKC